MRSVIVADWSEPVKFHMVDRPSRVPGPGEVRVRVQVAAVNYADALVALGRYQVRPQTPFTPGGECSGVVEMVGDGVEGFRPGDRVFATGFIGDSRENGRIIGAYAEEVTVPIANLAHIPSGMTMMSAALFRSNYETSFYALQEGRLAGGETLLVLGAGGATGSAAVEIGRALGARVIGSASSDGRRRIARDAGADIVIDSRSDDWRRVLQDSAGDRGIDVVFDPIGGVLTEPAFRSLRWGGRLLVIGFAAGQIPSLPLNLPLVKGTSIIGINATRMAENEPERASSNFSRLIELYEQGQLKLPPVGREYALEEVSQAVEMVLGNRMDGRVLIRVDARESS